MMSDKRFDWEFRNSWRMDDRHWYGFTWFAFSCVTQYEATIFDFGLLGFEIYIYFLRERKITFP